MPEIGYHKKNYKYKFSKKVYKIQLLKWLILNPEQSFRIQKSYSLYARKEHID